LLPGADAEVRLWPELARPFESLRCAAWPRSRRSGALADRSPEGVSNDDEGRSAERTFDEDDDDSPDEPSEPPVRGAADPVVLPFDGLDSAAGRDSGRSFAWRAQAGLTVSVNAAPAVQSVSARRVMRYS